MGVLVYISKEKSFYPQNKRKPCTQMRKWEEIISMAYEWQLYYSPRVEIWLHHADNQNKESYFRGLKIHMQWAELEVRY